MVLDTTSWQRDRTSTPQPHTPYSQPQPRSPVSPATSYSSHSTPTPTSIPLADIDQPEESQGIPLVPDNGTASSLIDHFEQELDLLTFPPPTTGRLRQKAFLCISGPWIKTHLESVRAKINRDGGQLLMDLNLAEVRDRIDKNPDFEFLLVYPVMGKRLPGTLSSTFIATESDKSRTQVHVPPPRIYDLYASLSLNSVTCRWVKARGLPPLDGIPPSHIAIAAPIHPTPPPQVSSIPSSSSRPAWVPPTPSSIAPSTESTPPPTSDIPRQRWTKKREATYRPLEGLRRTKLDDWLCFMVENEDKWRLLADLYQLIAEEFNVTRQAAYNFILYNRPAFVARSEQFAARIAPRTKSTVTRHVRTPSINPQPISGPKTLGSPDHAEPFRGPGKKRAFETEEDGSTLYSRPSTDKTLRPQSSTHKRIRSVSTKVHLGRASKSPDDTHQAEGSTLKRFVDTPVDARSECSDRGDVLLGSEMTDSEGYESSHSVMGSKYSDVDPRDTGEAFEDFQEPFDVDSPSNDDEAHSKHWNNPTRDREVSDYTVTDPKALLQENTPGTACEQPRSLGTQGPSRNMATAQIPLELESAPAHKHTSKRQRYSILGCGFSIAARADARLEQLQQGIATHDVPFLISNVQPDECIRCHRIITSYLEDLVRSQRSLDDTNSSLSTKSHKRLWLDKDFVRDYSTMYKEVEDEDRYILQDTIDMNPSREYMDSLTGPHIIVASQQDTSKDSIIAIGDFAKARSTGDSSGSSTTTTSRTDVVIFGVCEICDQKPEAFPAIADLFQDLLYHLEGSQDEIRIRHLKPRSSLNEVQHSLLHLYFVTYYSEFGINRQVDQEVLSETSFGDDSTQMSDIRDQYARISSLVDECESGSLSVATTAEAGDGADQELDGEIQAIWERLLWWKVGV